MSSYFSKPDLELRVPNELAREYLEVNADVTLTRSTVSTYDSHLTEYIGYLHYEEESVLGADIDRVHSFLEGCVRRGNRRSTLGGKLVSIAELYRYIRLRTEAADELNIDPLQFREIDLDQYNTPEKIEREALSREEIRLLFDAFDSARNRLMTIVGIETGIRNSDIRNLRLIDIQSDEIHVHEPKNSSSYDVPISEQLAFEIEMWRKHRRPAYASAENSEYVFPSQYGERLAQNESLNSAVKQAAERADIQEVIATSPISPSEQETLNTDKKCREWKRVTVHTLRHSYITLLQEAGVSLPYRQLVANHSDPETTRGYSHAGNSTFDDIRDSYDPPR